LTIPEPGGDAPHSPSTKINVLEYASVTKAEGCRYSGRPGNILGKCFTSYGRRKVGSRGAFAAGRCTVIVIAPKYAVWQGRFY